MPSAAPPSGQQLELSLGAQRAVVVEVGGGLREYAVGEHHVLDGYARQAMADGGRGQPLVPWPNRLGDGQYEWDGQKLQLPIDELARRNASHGLTRWLAWTVAQQTPHGVTMRQVIHPRPGYPFHLEVEIEYALSDAGLAVTTRATNRGERALPYGLGFHPYLSAGTPTIDSAELGLPAAQVLEVDERMLPTGTLSSVVEREVDFRAPRLIGSQRIDGCFTSLERAADGLARVTLSAAGEAGRTVTMWLDQSFSYLQVFTGDTLAEGRRRRGLAVEPMTCPPNAFRSGCDVVRLEPGATHTSAWGLSLT